MAAIIRIKRSTGSSAPGTLKTGELAYSAGTGLYNNGGDRLYFGKGDDGNGNATTVEVIGGAYFANLADHAPGTLTASSAIVVDANKKVDQLLSGDIVVDGATNKITGLADPSVSSGAATKNYVDTQIAAGNNLPIAGDAGTDTVDLATDTLTFTGDSWITTTVTDNAVTFTHDSSGVVAGTYGSATAIPVFTVDDRGHIDSAGEVAIATTLATAAESGTGSVSLLGDTLTIAAGEGINTVASGTTITVSAELATETNAGVATFDGTHFTVTAGDVAANQFTIGSTNLNLGGSTTVLAGLTQIDVDNVRILDNTVASTTGVLYIDPNPIDSDGGEVIIRGNLTVNGVTTTVNSTTVSINDKNIVLADSAASAGEADGAGLTINGPTTPATFTYNGSTDAWNFNKPIDLSTLADLKFGGVELTEALEDHFVTNFFLAGEGIDLTYVDGSNTLTIAAELATYTNPGVANFDSDQFTVTSGFATISVLDGGTY